MSLKLIRTMLAVSALCGALAGSSATAQEGEMPVMGAPEQMNEVAFMVGTWDAAVQMKMDPSMTEWVSSQATVKTEAVLDGCFLVSHFDGMMMGMPFKGMSVLCYDREAQTWQNTWMDNMGARISYSEGGKQDDGSIVFEGEDMMMGQKMQVRQVSKNITDTSYDWSMWVSTDGGKNYAEMMKTTYTKQ